MPLLNYTTRVSAAKTMAELQKILVDAGARSIMAKYDVTGRATGLAFAVETPPGMRTFTLPIDVEPVRAVLLRQNVEPRYSTVEHAEQVAWRIVKDWVEAQLAIVATEMVTLDCVMLPYMQGDVGRTVYELYVDRQLALPEAGR